jgi:hypothetical protein
MTPRPCENCGEPDPQQSHYDAWGDWGGDGPDGWCCEYVPGARKKWEAWRAQNDEKQAKKCEGVTEP